MRQNLGKSLQLVFGDEGGYSNVKTDSGGPTKFGITHKTLAAHRGLKAVSAAQVKELTLAEAGEIYEKSYWIQSGGNVLPSGLDYAVFNSGIMSGPARAVRVLQKLVGVLEDGNIGPMTLEAVKNYRGGMQKLIKDYCTAYVDYLKTIKNPKTGFPVNGRGWVRRITGIDPLGKIAPTPGVVGHALDMSHGQHIEAPPEKEAGYEVVVTDGGDARAIPDKPNPLTKPEVIGPIVAGGLSAAAPFAQGPVIWAIAGLVLIAAVIGGYYAIRRINKTVV